MISTKFTFPPVRDGKHRAVMIILLCVLLAAILGGCSLLRVINEPRNASKTTETELPRLTETEPAESAQITATNKPTAKTSAPAPTARPALAPSNTAAFEDRISAIILAGLQDYAKEIKLDAALAEVRIPASMADATIERIFDLYQTIYFSHPEFYFLSGQAHSSYTLQHGAESTLEALTLKPGFIDSAADKTSAEIAQRQRQLLSKATEIAKAAKAKSNKPELQLLAIHDALVRLISYDETAASIPELNRERSHAASALLDGLALCQGYAASFQLVAQQLGFEVLMPTGTAGGVNHAWNLVRLGDSYYHIDLTYDDPTPDGGPDAPVEHVHFLRSDAQMRRTHIWNAADFPAAPADSAAYYHLNDLVVNNNNELMQSLDKLAEDLPQPVKKPVMLELLYTGEPPDFSTVEGMLEDALALNWYDGGINYRGRVDKDIILLEIVP